MKRIILMLVRNFFRLPYYTYQLLHYAHHVERYTENERFSMLENIDAHAIAHGNVTIEVHGEENVPERGGFMYYPNHQGFFDVLAMIQASPVPFSVVAKKEVGKVPYLKQVIAILRGYLLDREDVRQAMKVIIAVANEVKQGRNYLIFPEGTRSRKGNQLGTFKGGSFKAATMAKCPIVPVALIDSFRPFDTGTTERVTVQVHFMKPLQYEDYREMKTTEIADMVSGKIQNTIDSTLQKRA